MNHTIITAIIFIISATIGYFAGAKKEKKRSQTVTSHNAVPDYGKKRIHTVKLYTINSRYWANVFESQKYEVDECTVFLRNYVKTNLKDAKRKFDEEREEAIAVWKKLYCKGQIKNLRIYEYDHLSDLYYGIIDDECVYSSFNLFDDNNSTGQTDDVDPVIFCKDEHKSAFKKYMDHFQNMQEHYSSNIIVSLP